MKTLFVLALLAVFLTAWGKEATKKMSEEKGATPKKSSAKAPQQSTTFPPTQTPGTSPPATPKRTPPPTSPETVKQDSGQKASSGSNVSAWSHKNWMDRVYGTLAFIFSAIGVFSTLTGAYLLLNPQIEVQEEKTGSPAQFLNTRFIIKNISLLPFSDMQYSIHSNNVKFKNPNFQIGQITVQMREKSLGMLKHNQRHTIRLKEMISVPEGLGYIDFTLEVDFKVLGLKRHTRRYRYDTKQEPDGSLTLNPVAWD